MTGGGLLFFFYFASFCAPGRFLSLFYKFYGLNDAQVGILCSAGYLLAMLMSPVINNTADKLNERELICIAGYTLSLACFLLQRFAITLPAMVAFPFLLLTSAAYTTADSATYPLVSALSLSKLKLDYGDDAHDRFGLDRMWGAVSWAIVALAFGVIADKAGDLEMISYFAKLFFGLIFIFALTVSRILREKLDESSKRQLIEKNESENNDVSTLSPATAFRSLIIGGLPTASFFLLVFVLEAGMSNVENLLFIYFYEDLGASYSLCGLTVVVTVIFEVPLFALAPQLLNRFGSKYLATIGALSFAVRGFGYSMVRSGWAVLFLEPLHGITIAAMATASVSFVSERTPPQLEATSQSLLTALLCLANVTGVALGGIVMQLFGSRVLYSGAGAIVLCATVAFLVIDTLFGRQDRELPKNRIV